jgi:serine/threonine protein kinase
MEPVSEAECATILEKILFGLDSLHNIKRRAFLNLESILFVGDEIKISAVDIAEMFLRQNPPRNNCINSVCDYAPEDILCGRSDHNLPGDVWNVGCLAIFLVSGKYPFEDITPLRQFFMISHRQVVFPQDISEIFEDFLKLCFRKDPQERPTVEELLNHTFIQNCRRRLPSALSSTAL